MIQSQVLRMSATLEAPSIISKLETMGWSPFADGPFWAMRKEKLICVVSSSGVSYRFLGPDSLGRVRPGFNVWPTHRILSGEFMRPKGDSGEGLSPEERELRQVVLGMVVP